MNKKSRVARTPEVALLLETSTEYGRGLLRGIMRYSRLHGPWSLYVSPGHLDPVLPKSKAWKLSGLIARIRSPEMERMIRAAGLPFVASSLSESRPLAPGRKFGEIRTRSEAIARMGATHLLEAGLRRLAFCGFVNCNWSAVRESAFTEFARGRGCPCSVHHIAVANWMRRPHWIENWQQEQPILARWLKSLPKPVGLMACNDVCGQEVLQACVRAGLRVPEEVAVVAADNDEMICGLSHTPLSSVALDLEKAGYEAARLLDGLMNGKPVFEHVVWVEPTHVAIRRSSDVIAQEDPLVAGALHFIRQHARNSLSVSDVTEDLRVSRRTLERRFHSVVGRTILSEILRCQLQRAKLLLMETDLPSYKVAAEAGFGSLKTFNRNFGRAEGVTPQQFRQRLRGAAVPQTAPRTPGTRLPDLSPMHPPLPQGQYAFSAVKARAT